MSTVDKNTVPMSEAEQNAALLVSVMTDPRSHNDRSMSGAFAELYKNNVRFVKEWKSWIVWDGRRWERDESGKLSLQVAGDFGRALWKVFSLAANEMDPKGQATLFKVVTKANSVHGAEAMLSFAGADRRLLISSAKLNTNPMLFCMLNGTIDLSDDSFRPHEPADLITQIANVAYDPEATCPQWDKTFRLIFGGGDDEKTGEDMEMIRYVQQVFGYSLNGTVAEAILPIAHGNGCNGKSTIAAVIFRLMGDYATVASESFLLGVQNRHDTEKASLYQRRMVTISEPPEDEPLRESRVKELTGGDTVSCRRMYENEWTFEPTHTFWLSTNHLPKVTGRDEGIWRRLMPIPFEIDLRDKVEPKPEYHQWLFQHEASGVLNWLLAGHHDWHSGGFAVPQAVEAARAAYRSDEDVLGQFIAECCVVGEEHMGTAKSLFDKYIEWSGKNSVWSKIRFGKELSRRFEKDKPNDGAFRRQVIYHGIAVDDF